MSDPDDDRLRRAELAGRVRRAEPERAEPGWSRARRCEPGKRTLTQRLRTARTPAPSARQMLESARLYLASASAPLGALEAAALDEDPEAVAVAWSDLTTYLAIVDQSLRDVEARQGSEATPEADAASDDVFAIRTLAARVLARAQALVRSGPAAPAHPADVQQRAAEGVASGRGGPIPFLPQIQASFGHHDVTDIRAHVGGEAAAAASDMGAMAYATGNQVAFASAPDLHTAAHEAAHVIQQRAGVARQGLDGGAGDAFERHADRVADAVVRGQSAEWLLDRMAGAGAAASVGAVQRRSEGKAGATAKPGEDKSGESRPPDLGDAAYQWVPGTYKIWVKASWFRSASDFEESGASWLAPSRVRELLTHLKERSMLAWASPEMIGSAAARLGVLGGKKSDEVFRTDLGATAFRWIGLPPGATSLIGFRGQTLDVVVRQPEADVDHGEELPLSRPLREQILAAVEHLVGMPAVPTSREGFLTADLRVQMGNDAVAWSFARQDLEWLFGAEAYRTWLDGRKGKEGAAFTMALGQEAQTTDLSPEEVTWVQRWLERNLERDGERGDGQPIVLSRLLLETLQKVDAHPERARILASLRSAGAAAGQLSAEALERIVHQAEMEAAREAMGLSPREPGKGTDRPTSPTFDIPLPARIDQRSGLVIAGEKVTFEIAIDWPSAYSREQELDYSWRNRVIQAEWVFERNRADRPVRTRKDGKRGDGSVTHRFELDEGEVEATWAVHAFVHHNFFQPNHLTTQVQVKTEAKRLEELRTASFTGLGQPRITEGAHDFDTSLYNEAFGDEKYDQGLLLRGELPADFQRRTPGQRLASLDADLRQQQALLAYLRQDGAHPSAIGAAEHHLTSLREARAAMESDEKSGWRSLEVRGFFLGRESRVADGPLDLHAAVRLTQVIAMPMVQVQIRDLSRRLGADTTRFEGIAPTFERAFERAFVDLCKKYPPGRVSALAEEIDPTGAKPTGKTVGFELHTGTEWKDTKEVVFDPVASAALNIGSAVVMIFAPATIPVLLPMTIAYNAGQTVDQMVDEWTSGTLTPGKGALYLSTIGLDLLPLVSRARVIRSSSLTFALVQGFDLAGQAVVMTLAAKQQIQALRDRDIAAMADVYAQLVELEATTHASDPALARLRADVSARAMTIRGRTAEVWTELVKQQAISFVPIRAAVHLERQITSARLGQLGRLDMLSQRDGVAPVYDRMSGQIVGDERSLDLPAIERLTAEQDAHMRELADELAAGLGVESGRVVIKPDQSLTLWDDGVDIQARYTPGTDPGAALARWLEQARVAHIGVAAERREASKTRRRARRLAGERLDAIPAELKQAGDPDSHATTEPAVPGSALRGRALTADPVAVKAATHAAMQSMGATVKGVRTIERITGQDALTPAARIQADDTYVVTLEEGPPLTIRLTSGPLEGETVARTVLNPSKRGISTVSRAGNDGATQAVPVAIEGRYVVQVSSAAPPVHVERVVVHEVTRILAERTLARRGQTSGDDLLAPGRPALGELSPHDLGRLAELNLLAGRFERGADPAASRELLALLDHLGLRDGAPGAEARRALVEPHLGREARGALARLGRPDSALDPAAAADLRAVRDQARSEAANARLRAEAERPLHERPDAFEPGAPIRPGERVTRERAVELARQAAVARANKSAATLARLRAEAEVLRPRGEFPRITNPQIGGGASLAARDPGALLIDERGRWQADPNTTIAQTASQLRGLKEAGLGDPFQFAGPDERVPLAAVRYWEDRIAAQGPVIDGRARLELGDDGRMFVVIEPSDGSVSIRAQVEGRPLVCTGFPPERIPGTPRGMTPEKAIETTKKLLGRIVADPTSPPELKERASTARAELEPLTGLRQGRTAREDDLTRARAILGQHGLDRLVEERSKDAHGMLAAGEAWHQLRSAAPDRVFLGDEANLSTLDPMATDDWVIAGSGGTGVSAAENILAVNPRARVALVGRDAPAGLLENDQLVGLLRQHADPQTARAIAARGLEIDLSGTDKRLSVVFGVDLGAPKYENGTYRAAAGTPEGYDAATNNPFVGGGYVAAIGREQQLPPMVAEMVESAMARGLEAQVEILFDRDDQYIGYRLNIIQDETSVVQSLDVTGAASRFPPWELVPKEEWPKLKGFLGAASDLDAPPESGNFDGGFVASATQAARYRRDRRAKETP